MKITVLGARGSVPVEGKRFLEFGGATSCVLVETEDQAVFLDAGSGIVNTPDIGSKSISILLTHPHLDHLLGMPFFPYLARKRNIDFYCEKRFGLNAKEQLGSVFAEPLWPVRADDYAAEINYRDIADSQFAVGAVMIDCMDSVHPGGGTVYKLTFNGRSMVYATDYEYTDEKYEELVSFAKGTDLLMIDAMYTDEEASSRIGYGHSSISQALKISKECGAVNVRFVHHDPYHDDEFINKLEASIDEKNIRFARKDEVIVL